MESQNKEEFKWRNSKKWKAQQVRHQMELTHTDTQAFPNSPANKINFSLRHVGDELEQPLAVLPRVTAMFSQMSKSTRGLEWASAIPAIFQRTREKTHTYTHTDTESLTEVQCIVMKIKDTLITAAKWYWTSVTAREGTSKNEHSWTSHKTKSLSASAWGCKRGTRAPDSWTRHGSCRWQGDSAGRAARARLPPGLRTPATPLYPRECFWGTSVRLGGI